MMNRLARAAACVPLRKPLAAFFSLLSASVVLYCLVRGQDVLPGIRGLLETGLLISVGGYMGTSTLEALRQGATGASGGGYAPCGDQVAREETEGGV